MKEIFSAIVEWHKQNKRELPWRKEPTPYHVWLSEIMLQQTRIEAVIPYYHRFLSELPSIHALACCEDDKLLKLWQGLGYYSRARNLKKAALLVEEKFGGELPKEKEKLLTLPGIGDYTAGAISSIAFLQSEPAVDGNVVRVYSRLKEEKVDFSDLSARKKICALFQKEYPSGEDARALTEGIMELGETICIPNGKPLCERCPVQKLCLANIHQTTQLYPVKTPKIARKVLKKTVFLLTFQGKVAIQKREETGLLAGLYEFPCAEGFLSETEAKAWLKEKNLAVEKLIKTGNAKHIFTHLEWEMTGYLAECEGENESFLWVSREQIQTIYPIPTAYRYFKKIIET